MQYYIALPLLLTLAVAVAIAVAVAVAVAVAAPLSLSLSRSRSRSLPLSLNRPRPRTRSRSRPEFLLKWGSTGIYSESVIEAYHAVANQRRRTFAASADPLQYLQLCDDEDNRKLYVQADSDGTYLANQ